MKRILVFLTLSFALLGGPLFSAPVSASSYDNGRIIDDAIFDNSGTMSTAQIDSFLNQFSSSCISTNHGFSAPDPIGYNPTNGFSYGGNVSGGQVIHDAAQAYGINPQVLLTTLEKEQSLVAGGGGCSVLRYAAAAGYGCPDGGTTYSYSGVDLYSINGTEVTSVSGTCVNTSLKVGFSQQVIRAAWLLRFGEQRSEGNINWAVTNGNWNNSDDPQTCYGGPMTQGTWVRCPSGGSAYYDGYTSIDGTSVYLDNGATAALYWYTPHFSGNQNFDYIFTNWFGGLYATAYYAAPFSQSGSTSLNPGQQSTVYLSYKNLGTQTWYDDTSLSSAPSGTHPVHLATDNSINRSSLFSSTWPGAARPAVNFSAVYESDGTTLASNQHVASPGSVVKFSFTMTVPSSLTAGTYNEYFVPILEGTAGSFNDDGTYLTVVVNPIPALTWSSQSASPTVTAGTKSGITTLMLKNTGNTALYDDISIGGAPAGNHPVHLATTNPINTPSDFSATWPGAARPAVNFSAVYNPDGSLASNQHVAQPGQTIKFSFYISVPNQYANGSYDLHVQPILEGTSGYFTDSGIYWTVTVPSAAAFTITNNSPHLPLVSSEPGQISLTIKNVGNATADANTQISTSDGSTFQAPSWTSSSQIESLPASLTAGASTTISLPILAPTTNSNEYLTFNCSFTDNAQVIAMTSGCALTVNISAYNYTAAYYNESAWPKLVPGTQAQMYFEYKNNGNQPWYDDASVGTATWRNAKPVHLATDNPINRPSGFDSSWPGAARPAVNFSAVYNSNGSLASDQNVVQPGQIAKFSFTVSPSMNLGPGPYREYFQPIVEGTAGLITPTGTFEDITVLPSVYGDGFYSESGAPTVAAGSQATIYFEYKNTGNQPWYDDTSLSSAPTDTHPVHLATDNPVNRISKFAATWPSAARPAVNFSAVYDSNGTTIATDQHVVQPGQIAKFSFIVSAPANLTAGTYNEAFWPILEGTAGTLNDIGTYLPITVTP